MARNAAVILAAIAEALAAAVWAVTAVEVSPEEEVVVFVVAAAVADGFIWAHLSNLLDGRWRLTTC